MREFILRYHQSWQGADYIKLKFRKVKNRNLYYLLFKERFYIFEEDEIVMPEHNGLIELSKFLKFRSETELLWRLRTRFKFEIINSKYCYSKSETDKIIEWIESIIIMNKLTE